MLSSDPLVAALLERLRTAQPVRSRAMFGGHTIYCNEKVVALVCYGAVFVKPTEAGRAFIGDPVEAPAYEGAKNSFLIEEPRLSDASWLNELISLTEQALPAPKPKKPKAPAFPRSANNH